MADKVKKKGKKKHGIVGKIFGIAFLIVIIIGASMLFNVGKYFDFLSKVDNPAGKYAIPLWVEPDMTEWQALNSIPEPISVMSGEQDVVLGDYQKYGIEVLIPAYSFDQPTKISLQTPSESFLYDKNAMTPTSNASSFTIVGEQTRSNLPMIVKVKLNDNTITKDLGLNGLHFSSDGTATYIPLLPSTPNSDYISYEIYHNYTVSAAELSESERIEKFAKSKALESWARKNMDEEVKAVTEEMIREMMVQAFNINNPSEIEMIIKAATSEMKYGTLEFGKVANDLYSGDYTNLMSTVGTILGNTLALNMDSDMLESAVDKAGPASSMLGSLVNGDISGAGMHLANYISDKSVIVRAGKAWIEVVNTKVSNWKNNEIEKAYIAYRDGVEHGNWFGYKSIDPGDFEEAYYQMRGGQRQFEIDSIKSYLNINGGSESELTKEQRAEIIVKAKESLKKQFDQRIQQEDQIQKEQENQKAVIDQFNTWGLLKRGAQWFPEEYDIEQILTRLYGQIERIQKDTGRFAIVYRDGDLHDQSRGLDNIGKLKENEMLMSDLANLINTRYVYGEDAYAKLLVKMGYVDYVESANIEGTWSGTFQLKEVNRFEKIAGPIIKTIEGYINALMKILGSDNLAKFAFTKYDFTMTISNYQPASGNCDIVVEVEDDLESYSVTTTGKYKNEQLSFSFKSDSDSESNVEFNFKGRFVGETRISGDFSINMYVLIKDAGSGVWEMDRE